MRQKPVWVTLVVVLCFVAIKTLLFEQLSYFIDGFLFLQMSRGYLFGDNLLFESNYGNHAAIHNYFLVPFLAPFTLLFDMLGIFLVQAALWVFVAFRVTRLTDLQRHDLWFWLAVFLLGPMSFWIWDDFGLGWHIEQLYLPVSVLFTLALWKGGRELGFWALILCLLREDGPVMACCLHLGFALLCPEKARAQFSESKHWNSSFARLAAIVLLWFSVFLLEMAAQRMTAGGGSRTLLALKNLTLFWSSPEKRAELFSELMRWLVLVAAVLPAFLYTKSRRIVGVFTLTVLPLLAVHIVAFASYSYFIHQDFAGVTWSPRFVMVWALLASLCLLSLRQQAPEARTKPLFLSLLFVALISQETALAIAREYRFVSRIATIFDPDEHLSGSLTEPETKALHCLSDSLPPMTPVLVPYGVQAWFDQHFLLFAQHPEYSSQPARLFVCDKKERLLSMRQGCASWKQEPLFRGWPERVVGDLMILWSPTHPDEYIHQCLDTP